MVSAHPAQASASRPADRRALDLRPPGAGPAGPPERDSSLSRNPRVSIVTPSYNQGQFLEQTIQSVLTQDYPDLEYLVIDGGSTDRSVEIIQAHADRLAGWVSEKDLGQTDAINKGFGLASGEIFAWLNSDDTYQPGAVGEAVDYLRRHPEVGMVYGAAYYIDEDGRPVARYPAAPTDLAGLRRGRNTISQQAMFFRARLWRMAGPLDPTFYYAMDYDLWVRIAGLTPIAFHPRWWANFRLQSGSKSLKEAYRCWPEMMRVHFRDGGSVFSVLYAKYLVRRMVEPLMPLRMRLRRWTFRLESRRAGR
jgi:glycosyltransferase involved in cell wall biosynthesis